MFKVSSNTFVIKDESEFMDECQFAYDVIDYADKLGKENGIRWFFKECCANWNDGIHFVIFDSYVTEEYKDYILSLKVAKNAENKFDIKVQKQCP